MEVPINWWGVILAMVSSMVVGFIWYARPVFGNKWAKLVGLSPKQLEKGSFWAIPITMLVSLITAYVLAHVAYLSNSFFQNTFLHDTLTTAFWLWLGFTAARLITHDQFEQRSVKLTALNITHEFITIMIMGLVIGLFKP